MRREGESSSTLTHTLTHTRTHAHTDSRSLLFQRYRYRAAAHCSLLIDAAGVAAAIDPPASLRPSLFASRVGRRAATAGCATRMYSLLVSTNSQRHFHPPFASTPPPQPISLAPPTCSTLPLSREIDPAAILARTLTFCVYISSSFWLCCCDCMNRCCWCAASCVGAFGRAKVSDSFFFTFSFLRFIHSPLVDVESVAGRAREERRR